MAVNRPIENCTRGYKPVDYLMQGYLAFAIALVLFCHNDKLPDWPRRLIVHVALMLAVHGLLTLHQVWKGRLLDLLRCFYPMMLFTFFYLETHHLDDLFAARSLDPLLRSLDQGIFGCRPAVALMARLPYRWISEPLYLAYASYYVMVFGVGLVLYVRDTRRFMHYLTVLSFVFVVCYLTFIFLPAAGPYGGTGTTDAPAAVRAGPFYKLMLFVYEHCEPEGGAAFPSSHVAAALVTLCFTWRYLRRIRWLHAVDVLLLSIATVYCGYHYVVDVLAGVVVAAALIPIAELLYSQFDSATARGGPARRTCH